MTTSVREAFRKVVLLIFLILMILPVVLETVANLSHKSYLLAFLASCLLFAAAWFGRCTRKRLRDRINCCRATSICLLLSVLCLLENGIFAFFFRPVQAADYRTFFQVAKDLSLGVHPGMKDYVAMFPHILGYASFLSMFLKLFGPHLAIAVALNVVLTTVSGMILFCMVLRRTDLYAASLTFLLWIFCPSKMFYNTMSLSEPYYTCLLLLFFLAIQRTEAFLPKGRKGRFIKIIAVAFVLGLVAAGYSSADGTLTALTTTFCYDFLKFGQNNQNTQKKELRIRRMVHVGFAFLYLLVIIAFRPFHDQSLINIIFDIAGFTYGPLLGLYTFGLFTKRNVNDRWVPYIAVLSPIICYILKLNSPTWFGYTFGFEILLLNGLITFLLLLLARPKKEHLS